MKKKKLLFGLAAATAALFSLAACNNGTANQSTSVPTSAESSTDASKSTEASQSTPEAQTFTATYVAIVDGAKDTAFLSKTATSVNGKFARPTDAEMAKEGYVFQGFYTSATTKNEFSFDAAVTADTTIYAKYHKSSMYDTLAASANKVFATDFGGTVSSVVDSDLKFDSNAVTIKTKSNDNITFNGTEAIVNKDAFIIDLGTKMTKPGVYTLYFETTFKGSVAGESFAQINGSTNGTDYARVFEIRTGSNKFEYSFDGNNKIASSVTAQTETLYKVLITLDTAEGKVSATVNDEKVADNISTNITSVNGLKFQTKSDGSTKKSIGHVAMTFEEKTANPLVTAKTQALATIDTYMSGNEYTALKASTATDDQKAKLTLIDAQISKSKKAIETAETVADVQTAQTEWTTFETANKYVVTVTPYSAAQTAISTLDAYKIAVVSGNTVSLTNMSYNGYISEGVYTNQDLTTEFATTTTITADTQLYAKLRVAQVFDLTYTAASEAPTGWEQTGTFGSVADGEGTTARPTTGTYDCLRIELKSSNSTNTYLKTPTIQDATTSVIISMTGWTNGSGDRKNYITATAYNSNDEAIGTVKLYTPDKKQKGDFTGKSDGTETEVLLTATGNISYVKFTCNTDGKGYYIVTAKVSYYK